jgi:hypothetical protein
MERLALSKLSRCFNPLLCMAMNLDLSSLHRPFGRTKKSQSALLSSSDRCISSYWSTIRASKSACALHMEIPFAEGFRPSQGEIIITIPPAFGKLNSTASDLEDCVSEWKKLTQTTTFSKFVSADEGLGALAKIQEMLSASIQRMMVRIVYLSRILCTSDGYVQMRTALRTEVMVTEASLRLVSPCILMHTRSGLILVDISWNNQRS